MLTHLYYEPQTGDETSLNEHFDALIGKPASFLNTIIARKRKDGLEGTHQESLLLIALYLVFKKRFDHCPLYYENNENIGIKPLSELTDQERLSRMQYELNTFGELRSMDMQGWWMSRY
jgi:hypothetical protein